MIDVTRDAFDELADFLRDEGEDEAAGEVDRLLERCVEEAAPDATYTLVGYALKAFTAALKAMLTEPIED